MARPYSRDPNSLDVLRKYIDPLGQSVSRNVLENDPELDLPIATTNAEQDSNDKLKRIIGLGPSPALIEQRNELTTRDRALNAARISAEPEVEAQTNAEQARKLALAGEPNRVAGGNAIALEKVKQEPLREFMSTQNTASDDPNAMHFIPTVTENGVSFRGEPSPKLNQNEQMSVDAAHQISSLVGPLFQRFQQRYGGIDADPSKYGSPFSDTLSQKLSKGVMSFGGLTSDADLQQQISAIQAWLTRAEAGGRMPKPMIDIIANSAPQTGLSPGLNYERMRTLVNDILPNMLKGIQAGRAPGALSLPSADKYANPDYQPQ